MVPAGDSTHTMGAPVGQWLQPSFVLMTIGLSSYTILTNWEVRFLGYVVATCACFLPSNEMAKRRVCIVKVTLPEL